MRIHTQELKNEIKNFGRQINGRIYYYSNYNLLDESNNNILTEDNIQLILEQFNKNEKTEINNELIYSMDIIKNGQLLQSLMKEFDFNAKFDLKIGTAVNAQLGLLVNNDYEYLDYGDYIIYSKQYNADTETYSYVCYDMMLYSMIKYKPLNITYPTTIKGLISAIADKIGVGFANVNEEFTNYNQVVEKDLFGNQNVTYRDILDKLSEVTASNILINDDNELELGYPNETNDTINESYLKDVNVAFNEIFGPINKVAITSDSISYVKQDDASIETNGLTQINITNNLLALNGDTDTICQAILNKLNGLYYSINDFTTTGVCYYDYLDLFNVEARGNTYKCLLLNNEIHITQGIQENIFTQKKENTETSTNNYEVSTPDNKTVQFTINQQKGELQSKVKADEMNSAIEQKADEINLEVSKKVGNDEIISKINQSPEQISINANKISLAGKIIDMTSDNIAINSTNFNVTNVGVMSCTGANITGGDINMTSNHSNSKLVLTGKSLAGTDSTNKLVADGLRITSNSKESIKLQLASISSGGTSGTGGILELYNSIDNRFASMDYDGFMTGTGGNPKAYMYSDGEVHATSYTGGSLESIKKNIELYKENAIYIIQNSDIYNYNLKTEDEGDKKHIGLVIADGKNKYRTPKDIISKNGDGIDLYSMISLSWKAIQEQQAIIEDLQQRISKLEKESK